MEEVVGRLALDGSVKKVPARQSEEKARAKGNWQICKDAGALERGSSEGRWKVLT